MTEKEQHLNDANNTLLALEGKTGLQYDFRRKCVKEFITFLETGKIDHINPDVDHFK